MKENSDLNKLFCEADRFVKIDKERRERTLERLYSVYEEMNGERTSVTAGYAEIVFSQLRYMDKGIWIADAAVNILFILILLLLRYYGQRNRISWWPRCCLHLLPEACPYGSYLGFFQMEPENWRGPAILIQSSLRGLR